MSEVPRTSLECREISPRMIFHVPKINKHKLVSELGASPKEFTKTRKEFKEWFEKTFTFNYGEIDPEINERPVLHVELSPNARAMCDIPDPKNLFLYLKDIPTGVTEKEFLIFLKLYQVTFKIHAGAEKAQILLTVEPNQEEKLAQFESENIILTLIKLQKMPPMHLPEYLKKILEKTPEVDDDGSLRQNAEIWSKKRPGIGKLFIDNIVSREQPEYDIPYLDELLCYHESMFFPTLINTTRTFPMLWGFWVVAHADLLINPQTETCKLFCAIFNIREGGMFQKDGTICPEAWLIIPQDLHAGMEIVERKKQDSIKLRDIQEQNKQRIKNILTTSLNISCDENFMLSSAEIPKEIHKISVTIRRSGKAVARTSFEPKEMPVDLKKCSFDIFHNTRVSWDDISQWKGGDIYTLEVEGKIDAQEGTSTIIHNWKPAKQRKETIDTTNTDTLVNENPTEIPSSSVPARVETILVTASENVSQPSAPPLVSEKTKDPKESEKKELDMAIELFLEKPEEELEDVFLRSHVWGEKNQTLTLSVPAEALKEIGYNILDQEQLPQAEYDPMLRWTGKQEKGEWIFPEGTPDQIKNIMLSMYASLLRNSEKETESIRVQEIDRELSKLGLPPSRRATNILQREFANICRVKPVNFTRLETKILDLGIREQGYRCFHNNANSITLTKIQGESTKNEWSITYNWVTNSFSSVGLEGDHIFQERLENILVRFLVRMDEEMVEEMLLPNMHTLKKPQQVKLDLEKGLKERLEKGQASFFARFRGHDILIPGVSGQNYEDKIQAIRAACAPTTSVFIVYRTSSYALYDGEYKKGQDETYNRCIEDHLDMIQARCRATLAQKAHYRESPPNGTTPIQERGPFINGVAGHCREFFLRKNPFDTQDMQEFLEYIHAEGTSEEKRALLYMGVRGALFGDAENTTLDPCICRKFFFKKDPNNLDDVADFMAFLQEKGMHQNERPGENYVGIVYNSPVIGPVSDITRILSTKKKEKD